MTPEQQIEAETKLIKELEASYPEYDSKAGRHHEKNREFELHHTKVRDAYWRRRMAMSRRDGDDLTETAKVY